MFQIKTTVTLERDLLSYFMLLDSDPSQRRFEGWAGLSFLGPHTVSADGSGTRISRCRVEGHTFRQVTCTVEHPDRVLEVWFMTRKSPSF